VGKDARSVYESGRRSPAWRKLKILRQQEFVVCGWTRPRNLRRHFGSLVLGYFEGTLPTPRLRFAGTAGSGFTDAELDRVWRLLGERPLDRCPFPTVPPTPEPAQWVRPELVAQVRFTEWTPDGVLRHPVYLGLRTDVDPHAVRREGRQDIKTTAAPAASMRTPAARRTSGTGARSRKTPALDSGDLDAVIEHLQTLEDARRDGTLRLPDGSALEVTNLAKVFWPGPRLTKGHLLRYYARLSPWLLPVVSGRPLVMKRYPNGVTGKTFYQQRAPEEVPAGVRVELVQEDDETRPRLVGGSLATLLYMTQLAAISQDPWFSRLDTRECPDHVALDLDPMPGVPFSQVLEVARAIRDELAELRVPAVAKTSGSSGLHIYLPLAAGTPYAAGQLFCQIVATMIASRLPHVATVERAVARRGRTVYIDYLQNIEGKTLACAYSARSSEFAGVSTPLAWQELDERIDPHDFTLPTVVDRFRATGNLWAPIVSGPPLDLRDALERLQVRTGT
jgi:bifunctional non-homologous end joining protein LigD